MRVDRSGPSQERGLARNPAHTGQHGVGFNDSELTFWAERIARATAQGCDVYAYFNNDPDGHATVDAQRLRTLLDRTR